MLPQPTARNAGGGNPAHDPVVVAIPVRNEADRIGACLADLIAQTHAPDAIVCLLNNCTDDTAGAAASIAATGSVAVHLISRDLPPAQANAGYARRLAMAQAARLAGAHGVLLTTDADTRIGPHWIALNLAQMAAGADAVCGQAVIDPIEACAIPDHLHADDALETRYAALLDTLGARLDADPADPLPRHTQESGASIAVRAAVFRAVGGIPPVALGEDRAFIDALRRHDARIRHAPEISVVASGRTEGRAAGGMADTMRRRIGRQDTHVDALLEPAADRYRRMHFRARLRAAWRAGHAPDDLVADLHVPHAVVAQALSAPYFGAAWAGIEDACKLIRRRRVAFNELPRQIDEAVRLLQALEQDRAPARVREEMLP